MLRKSIILLLGVFFVLQTSLFVYAQSSPSSFSSITTEADPHTGSANLSIPIQVPTGRGGIQPNLAIAYNSSNPNGMFGVGWGLEIGSIKVLTKNGAPTYDSNTEYMLMQSGSAQELVEDPADPGIFYPKVESAFLKIEKLSEGWQVTDTNGIKYFYGTNANKEAQEFDPADPSRIYKWCLEKVVDLHGNYMEFSYFRDETNGDNVLYPDEINYGGNEIAGQTLAHFAKVKFNRSTPRSDIQTSYLRGFKGVNRYLINNIVVSVEGTTQRTYQITYNTSPETGRSILQSVQMLGANGGTDLPAMQYVYQVISDGVTPSYELYTIDQGDELDDGDNLWNFRTERFDIGDINYGPLPGFGVELGETITDTYWEINGRHWQTNTANGHLEVYGAQDRAYLFWTYIWADHEGYYHVDYNQGSHANPGVYINNSNEDSGEDWYLKEGPNLIVLTMYNTNQGFHFIFEDNITDVPGIIRMNSTSRSASDLVGDFNGDGQTDLATFEPSSGTVRVALANDQSFAPEEVWIENFGVNSSVVAGDFNGDGRMDLMTDNQSADKIEVALSQFNETTQKNEFYNNQVAWREALGNNESLSAGDFDNDGLSDLYIYFYGGGMLKLWIEYNKGGYFDRINPDVYEISPGESDIPVLGDYNGDGLLDLGGFNKTTGTWIIKLNSGNIADDGFIEVDPVNNWGANKIPVVADYNYDGASDVGFYNPSGQKFYFQYFDGERFEQLPGSQYYRDLGFTINDNNLIVQTADFDGDTIVDFFVINPNSGSEQMEVSYSIGKRPDLISEVHNGVGGVTEITYAPVSKAANTELPFPIQVVKSVTVTDTKTETRYTTTNLYEGGKWDVEDREFRGFQTVQVYDPERNKTETIYHQDDILKGRVAQQSSFGLMTDEFDENYYQEFNRTVFTWEEVDANIHPGTESTFIALTQKDNFVIDTDDTDQVDANHQTRESYEYNGTPQYGQLMKTTQWGEVEFDLENNAGSDIGQDKRTVETEYVHNESANILNLPKHVTIKNNNGDIMRQTWFTYDNLSYGVQPTKGLLTEKEDWKEGNKGDANNPRTQYVYEGTYGNLWKTIDPIGVSTADPNDHITAIEYDDTYHIFPKTTTNAMGHAVQNVYYGVNDTFQSGYFGLWGQLKSTTDPNNETGTKIYDEYGRLEKSIAPIDSLLYPTVEYDYDIQPTFSSVTTYQRVESGSDQTIESFSCYDGLGRLSFSRKVSSRPEKGAYIISGETLYNSRGLPEKQFINRYTNDAAPDVDETRPYVFTEYDEMGRVIKVTQPHDDDPGTNDEYYSSVEYKGWQTDTYNENGHKQTSIYDAYGRLVEKYEYAGSDGRAPWIYAEESFKKYSKTEYTYDSEGNLTKTMQYGYDQNENLQTPANPSQYETRIHYNNLGQKERMFDPDMGGFKGLEWEYKYDLNGNLIRQTDAKGQVIKFEYDELNRLREKYDENNPVTGMHVTYDYDNEDAGNKGKGRLTQANYGPVADNTQFVYDQMGRENQSTKMLDGSAFDVTRAYDALSRLTNVEYPDTTQVFYGYNTAGEIEVVANSQQAVEDQLDENQNPPQPPSQPQGLTNVVEGDGYVDLQWTNDPEVDSYSVIYGTDDGGPYPNDCTGETLSSVHCDNLTNGITYYFVVYATKGALNSINSDQVFGTPQFSPPDDPTGLIVTEEGDGYVDLAWNNDPSVENYFVLYGTDNGGPYPQTCNNINGATAHCDNLTNGQTYYFVVYARANNLDSGYSNQADSQPQAPQPPATPTGLFVTAQGDGYVDLEWQPVAGSGITYTVKHGLNSEGPFTYTTDAGSNTSVRVDTNLTNGITYYFVVTATQNSLESAASSPSIPGTPQSPPPGGSAQIEVDNITENQANDVSYFEHMHQVGTGSNRILIVSFAAKEFTSAVPEVTSMTFNSLPLTRIARETNTTSAKTDSEMWYLLNPPSGNYQLQINLSGEIDGLTFGVISLNNVKQQSYEDVATSSGTGNAPSVSLTTITDGAWVVDSLAHRGYTTTTNASSGQTEFYKIKNSPDVQGGGSYKEVAIAGSTTIDWNLTVGKAYAYVAAAFAPADLVALNGEGEKNKDENVLLAISNDNKSQVIMDQAPIAKLTSYVLHL
ncbi:MAG: VCBS repeat-containing protein, partial [Candidatus Omnitrophica bacterium]|nr:VCBS repeat-containing protein [Candidatus Omnitrophota bacterium]